MHSPERAWWWLLHKEWRELLAARAWWLFLLLFGPLVGVAFISAVNSYAEASGLRGTAAGTGEAFSPLVGIWAPTFSACELAAAFLLPFVAIRLVAGDKQSGALKLEMQHRLLPLTRLLAKYLVLVAAWLIASLAVAAAVVLWRSYGGSIYLPELAVVFAGHLLNAGLTIALAVAAAAITTHPSTAAIATLAVTIGSWVVSFVAAVHGGWWELAANYTPAAMVALFQHGLVRMDVVLVCLTLIAAGLSLAAVWLRMGVAVRRRVRASMVLALLAAGTLYACGHARASRDFSENRMNSFSVADERALRRISMPLYIEVHLAPEDPRRADLEQRALSKLRRVMPAMRIKYISATSIGLFEQSREDYGEIRYELGGRREVSRATTEEGVLETIYALAGISVPGNSDYGFRGHPLAVPPSGAAWIFYVLWPALVLVAAWRSYRRR